MTRARGRRLLATAWGAAVLAGCAATGVARAQADPQALADVPRDAASSDAAPRFVGALGLGASGLPDAASARGRRARPLPYAYGDLGPLFARVDTFGVRLLPMGAGSLELVARASDEGREASPAHGPRRADPRPWGLGTFQETRWGGVFADAFVDLASGGTLLETSYVAELRTGPVTWYPQVGLARRDARWRQALYGRADDRPGAGTTPTFALSLEAPVAARWSIDAHVERERFDAALAHAPTVDHAGRTRWLVALVRQFD